MTAKISTLYTYPLKSGQKVCHSKIKLEEMGLEGDREFVIVDENGDFLSQRKIPQMALLRLIKLDQEKVLVESPSRSITLKKTAHSRLIKVWDDTVESDAYGVLEGIDFLPQGASLFQINPKKPRHIKKKHTQNSIVPYGFADGFPLLIASESSLKVINSLLQKEGHPSIPMSRFRPNIVISGWEPFWEHKIKEIVIDNRIKIKLPKPCTRCIMTTIDQSLGVAKGKEPLAALKKLASETGGLFFGQNGYLTENGGTLKPGQTVTSIQ